MRKTVAFITAALIPILCTAQHNHRAEKKRSVMKMSLQAPVAIPKETKIAACQRRTNARTYHSKPIAQNETIIGTTTYDLQTNTAIARRLFNHGDGTLSATWTFSTDMGGSWPDRGTGYNFFNGTSWGANPTVRIETIRTGWPEIISTSSGSEVLISHDPANGVLIKNDRATVGTGAWAQAGLSVLSPTNMWLRMAVGGANGQTIHLIGLTSPISYGGSLYNGLDGALLYSRSQDGGVSWDILAVQIPGADTSNFSGFNGDSYCIDARGDVVAIVASDLGDGIAMWKSTDNGSTWTMRWPVKPQIPKFAEDVHNTDIILNGDSMYSSDRTSAVLIDNNDVVHAFWGRQYIVNDDITDGLLNYFPGINAIDYWNENMRENHHDSIAGGYMNDNNWVGWANYRFNGQAGYPHAGIDANGCIYMTYSAVTDFHDGNHNYRHIYGVKSCDGGCSWMAAKDVVRDPNGSHQYDECVYASLARKVDTAMHFIWQRDDLPSVNLIDQNHPVVLNDIVYSSRPTSFLDTTYAVCLTYITGDTAFGQGDSTLLTASCGNAWVWSTGETTQSIYADSYQTYSVTVTTNCGTAVEQVTTTNVDEQAETGEAGIHIYPNPGNGMFTLALHNMTPGKHLLTVSNSIGEEVFRTSLITESMCHIPIQLRHPVKGLYILKISDGENVSVKKLIVR